MRLRRENEALADGKPVCESQAPGEAVERTGSEAGGATGRKEYKEYRKGNTEGTVADWQQLSERRMTVKPLQVCVLSHWESDGFS